MFEAGLLIATACGFFTLAKNISRYADVEIRDEYLLAGSLPVALLSFFLTGGDSFYTLVGSFSGVLLLTALVVAVRGGVR